MTSVSITVHESIAIDKNSIENLFPTGLDIKNRLVPIVRGNSVIFVEYQSTA